MPTAYADWVFAHQGGWDEMLYAAVPIGLIFSLLRLANSRAKKQVKSQAVTEAESDSPTPQEH